MKKTSFIAIAIIMFLVACSNGELLFEINSETNQKGRAISLSASMPGSDPSTRVGLIKEADNTIALRWQKGDKLQLAFVQGTNKVKSTVTLTADNITNEGKKAEFEIDIPQGIEVDEVFDLYGVYGGGNKKLYLDIGLPGESGSGNINITYKHDGDGLSAENSTDVILPSNTGEATSLEDIENRKDVMIYFKTQINASENSRSSVIFQHLGSLFSITLRNTSDAKSLDLQEARLFGVNGDGDWAYNNNAGGNIFDLVTEKYQEITSGGNHISFRAKTNTLPSGGSITFWGWYPPLPDKTWPELKLQLIDENAIETTSINSKPARAASTSIGKSYYFYAEWDGEKLQFIEEEENTQENMELDIYLLIGQSNMHGVAEILPLDTITLPNVYLFNDIAEWENARNLFTGGINRYSTVIPRAPKLGPGYTFAKKVAELTKKRIGLVSNARGATAVEWWQKGYTGENDYDLYEEAVARVKMALKLSPRATLKGIIWHQGEGDNSTASSNLYMGRLQNMVNDFRADFNDPDLPIIVGEVGKWEGRGKGVNPVLRQIKENISHSDWVSSDGLTSLDLENNDPHFDTFSQRVLGTRYADKALELIYNISAGGVEIYTDTNFQGRSFKLSAGQYTQLDLERMGIGNNEIKSITVNNNYKVLLYQEDFADSPLEVSSDSSDIGSLFSSIQVLNVSE